MTEKTKIKLDTLISKFPDEYRIFFREIAEHAISLGYNPRFNDKISYADFVKSKHGKTILKISPYPNCSLLRLPALNMRFDGLPVCHGIFQEAAEFSANAEHCIKCNKCGGSRKIKYTLSDGSEIFGCCQHIRDIPSYSIENLSEIKDALKTQDDYLMSLIAT